MMKNLLSKIALRSLLVLGACFFVIGSSGCSGDPIASHVASVSKTNLQKLSNVYSLYVSRNSNKGPKDEATFREFLETDPSIEKNIGYMGIARDDFEKISISERDNAPLLVRYGLSLPPMSPKQPQVLETVGVDGVRLVIMSNGDIVEVSDDAEYKKMASGKWKENREDSTTPDYGKLGK